MDLKSKIQSIRELNTVGYNKPSNDIVKNNCEALKQYPDVIDYLTITRGLTMETLNNFNIGYDVQKDAISIPIYKRGELVNIKYRNLNPNASAKYTQEKGCEVWLYNEDGIAKGQTKGGVLIVEGEFDCMSAWQAGFKNVISPASGKDSYGMWLELLDTIPKIYISYDNDKAGKSAGLSLAERAGTEKSFEVKYPDGIKDANDFFKIHTAEDYKELIRNAKPYYKYVFQGVSDIITSLREKVDNFIKLDSIPFIEFEDGYVAVMSGVTNIGKTSIAMNVVNELADKDIPVLVLPIERGIKDVGKRFLQVRYKKNKDELRHIEDSEWEKIIPDIVNLPIYFSIPKIDEVEEIIKKAKRLFNVKFIIVDHLDLFVRKSDPKSYNVELASTIQMFKSLAQELDVIFIVVHHIRKQEGVGAIPKKPSLNDLKGSGSVKDDPEAVIMLSEPDKGFVEIDILKNKGQMGSEIFHFNLGTGRMGDKLSEIDKMEQRKSPTQKALDDF